MPSNDEPLGGDVPTANYFVLEVDGVEIGVFRQVTGLQVTVTVEEIREGGQNGFVRKVPGRMMWPHLVFRSGLTQSDALFDWMSKSSGEGFAGNKNALTRSTAAVTALDSTGARLRSWEFQDAFAVRWTGPDFEVGKTTGLEEELEVAHHGFKSNTQSK